MNKKQIVKIIKNDKRYKGNEDLLDDFIKSVTTKLDGIIKDIDDEEIIKHFAEKMISKSIVEVLKQNNRFKIYSSSNVIQKIDYTNYAPDLKDCDSTNLSMSQLKQIYAVLKKHDEDNDTKYLEIIKSRYIDKTSIDEIAQLLELDKDRIEDILFQMSEQTNKVLPL